MDWMRANKLRLSPDKTEVLLVGGSSDWMVGVQPVLDRIALPLNLFIYLFYFIYIPPHSQSSLGGSQKLKPVTSIQNLKL